MRPLLIRIRSQAFWLNFPTALLILILQRTPVVKLATLVEEMVVAAPLGSVLRSAVVVTAGVGVHSIAGATELAASTPSPLAATVGTPVSVGFSITGTLSSPERWMISGSVPPGLSFGGQTSGTILSATVLLSGTPTTAGSYTINLQAQDDPTGSLTPVYNYTVNVTSPTPVAPSFTTHPQDQTVVVGGNATFTSAATGNPAPTFQWKKGGADIPGATSATLTLNNAQPADAATYTVVAANSEGSATSNGATLTVNVPPVFTTHPQSQAIAVGEPVTFTAVATGDPPPTYQWMKNGLNISGATGSSYTINSLALSDAGSYSVLATNAAGSATSEGATLDVLVPPVITTEPVDEIAVVGSPVTFTVVATGNPPPAFQWKKDGVDIPGATSSTLMLGSVVLADEAVYTVVVTNSAGSVTSQNAFLTVRPPPVTPQITTHPESQSVNVGADVTFTVAASGEPGPDFQWQKDGVNIPGATSATLMITNVQLDDAGIYTAVATNIVGNATSNGATLTVSPTPVAPAVTQQPPSFSIAVDGTITFSVAVTGHPSPTVQWQRSTDGGANWSDLADGGVFSGATTATLRVTKATVAMNGQRFRAVVTNSEGSATSNAGTLSVAATTGPRMINLSALASAGAGENTLVLGFFINGTGSKTLLIRGSGPTLAVFPFNRPGTVVDPQLRVFNAAQQIISENDDWDPALAASSAAVGAFPLVDTSKDAAMTLTLAPGLYTVHLVNSGPIAEGLIEVYDLSRDLGSRLTNLSCRFLMNPGQTLIVGTALIGGDVPVLVRGVGPELGLPPYNIPGVLVDPNLELFTGSTSIGSSDDWEVSLAPFFNAVGAFSLTTGSKDAALRQSLSPGGYTVHATGKTGGGVAIVELYESPPPAP